MIQRTTLISIVNVKLLFIQGRELVGPIVAEFLSIGPSDVDLVSSQSKPVHISHIKLFKTHFVVCLSSGTDGVFGMRWLVLMYSLRLLHSPPLSSHHLVFCKGECTHNRQSGLETTISCVAQLHVN